MQYMNVYEFHHYLLVLTEFLKRKNSNQCVNQAIEKIILIKTY